ncbi:MAG: AEC family transporter [Desulfacinum sp.]|nr:AEC family transporter [Desulfacinum sp.]
MGGVAEGVFPVFALIALGAVLRRVGWTDPSFHKVSDRLVYYIFFPVMLFWKIGAPGHTASLDFAVAAAALSAVLLVYGLSLAYAALTRMPARQVGAFSQCCYRFNTYVGMAVVLDALGEGAVAHFALIISVCIPVINMCAVGTLLWFSPSRSQSQSRSPALFIRNVVNNPLIVACLAGFLYARLGTPFPKPVETLFRLMAWGSLPLALLSIGASLSFHQLRNHARPSLAAVVLKLGVLPIVGYGLLRAFHVEDLALKTAMIFFCLPTSTAIYILSSQMDSDPELASSAIVISTILSVLSLSAVVLFLDAGVAP